MSSEEIVVDALDLTERQQEAVRATLHSVLESPYFRRSKRYPAFLQFVVLKTLAGNAHQLKERLVADEVFGRSGDYDPSSDPVVRYTAGEVRKRLALYFGEHPEVPVRIELPLGGYTAEFHFRLPRTDEEPRIQPETVEDSENAQVDRAHAGKHAWASHARIGLGICLVAALLLSLWAVAHWSSASKRAQREFWWPVLHNDSAAVVVVGEGAYPALEHDPPTQSSQAPPTKTAQLPQSGDPVQDESRLVLGNVVAVSQVCNSFRSYGRDCKVIPAQSATLPEIYNNSVVLIGAFDNSLTRRFLSTLRYQLRSESSGSDDVLVSRMIVDQTGRDPSIWRIGRDRPSGDSDVDYAILARFHSDLNDGMVVVIAGLSPQGTHSIGEYICSSKTVAMSEIVSRAPKNWKGINFEAVLQINLMRGSPGHVTVVATQYW